MALIPTRQRPPRPTANPGRHSVYNRHPTRSHGAENRAGIPVATWVPGVTPGRPSGRHRARLLTRIARALSLVPSNRVA